MLKTNKYDYACRVCGLLAEEKPWGDDGKSSTHDICPCCGTEFGYEDCSIKAVISSRKRWIDSGAAWWKDVRKPERWDREEQMKNIPPDFL